MKKEQTEMNILDSVKIELSDPKIGKLKFLMLLCDEHTSFILDWSLWWTKSIGSAILIAEMTSVKQVCNLFYLDAVLEDIKKLVSGGSASIDDILSEVRQI